MTGPVANRLQAVLYQEACYLVGRGVASVADIDTASAHGPGLRRALPGPLLTPHLSGGGIEHELEHLGPPIESWWSDLGYVSITPEAIEELVGGVDAGLEPSDLSRLSEQCDGVLISLLKDKHDQSP